MAQKPGTAEKVFNLIEDKLRNAMWIEGGDQPTKVDARRFKNLKQQPSQETHPKAFDWYARMYSMTDAQLQAVIAGTAVPDTMINLNALKKIQNVTSKAPVSNLAVKLSVSESQEEQKVETRPRNNSVFETAADANPNERI